MSGHTKPHPMPTVQVQINLNDDDSSTSSLHREPQMVPATVCYGYGWHIFGEFLNPVDKHGNMYLRPASALYPPAHELTDAQQWATDHPQLGDTTGQYHAIVQRSLFDTHEIHATTLTDGSTCGECGRDCDAAELTDVEGSAGDACPLCLETEYRQCEECHEYHPQDETSEYNENHYCETCFNESFTTCERCDTATPNDDTRTVTNHNGYEETWCEGCANNHAAQCHDCDNYHANTNTITRRQYRNYEVCDECYTNGDYSSCQSCGEAQPDGDGYMHSDDNGTYCPDCWTPDEEEDDDASDTIRSYSATPSLHPQGPGPVWYGIELETESRGSRSADAVSVAPHLPHCILKEDGSLSDGFEIVSRPCSLNTHRTQWEDFFNNLPATLRSHDTTTCGMHVHVSRAPLSQLQISKIGVFLNHDDNRDFIEKIARRGNGSYSGTNYAELKHKKHGDMKYSGAKYTALNLQHDETIEFRIFKGTLKRTSFYKNLEFVAALVAFCAPAQTGTEEAQDQERFKSFVAQERNQYPHLYAYLFPTDAECRRLDATAHDATPRGPQDERDTTRNGLIRLSQFATQQRFHPPVRLTPAVQPAAAPATPPRLSAEWAEFFFSHRLPPDLDRTRAGQTVTCATHYTDGTDATYSGAVIVGETNNIVYATTPEGHPCVFFRRYWTVEASAPARQQCDDIRDYMPFPPMGTRHHDSSHDATNWRQVFHVTTMDDADELYSIFLNPEQCRIIGSEGFTATVVYDAPRNNDARRVAYADARLIVGAEVRRRAQERERARNAQEQQDITTPASSLPHCVTREPALCYSGHQSYRYYIDHNDALQWRLTAAATPTTRSIRAHDPDGEELCGTVATRDDMDAHGAEYFRDAEEAVLADMAATREAQLARQRAGAPEETRGATDADGNFYGRRRNWGNATGHARRDSDEPQDEPAPFYITGQMEATTCASF